MTSKKTLLHRLCSFLSEWRPKQTWTFFNSFTLCMYKDLAWVRLPVWCEKSKIGHILIAISHACCFLWQHLYSSSNNRNNRMRLKPGQCHALLQTCAQADREIWDFGIQSHLKVTQGRHIICRVICDRIQRQPWVGTPGHLWGLRSSIWPRLDQHTVGQRCFDHTVNTRETLEGNLTLAAVHFRFWMG